MTLAKLVSTDVTPRIFEKPTFPTCGRVAVRSIATRRRLGEAALSLPRKAQNSHSRFLTTCQLIVTYHLAEPECLRSGPPSPSLCWKRVSMTRCPVTTKHEKKPSTATRVFNEFRLFSREALATKGFIPKRRTQPFVATAILCQPTNHCYKRCLLRAEVQNDMAKLSFANAVLALQTLSQTLQCVLLIQS